MNKKKKLVDLLKVVTTCSPQNSPHFTATFNVIAVHRSVVHHLILNHFSSYYLRFLFAKHTIYCSFGSDIIKRFTTFGHVLSFSIIKCCCKAINICIHCDKFHIRSSHSPAAHSQTRKEKEKMLVSSAPSKMNTRSFE